MAWACCLGYTRRLRGPPGIFHVFLMILIFLRLNLVRTLEFNCKPVKHCHCSQGFDEDEWEIECPKGRRGMYDMTMKVKPLPNGDGQAFLTLICDPDKPEISSELIEGIAFNKMAENGASSHNVTEIRVQYCPVSTKTNPNMLKSLFRQMNLHLETLTSFVFVPSTKFSTVFPLDFVSLMPRLETLDLQKLNLTKIPDLTKLTHLTELRLRDNKIQALEPTTFKTTPKLQHLDLSLNNITDLLEDSLPASLKHLNLARNQIQRVSQGTLSRLRLLQELVLTRNPLKAMDPEAFSQSTALLHLQMDSALFEAFPKFQKLNIRELMVSYRDTETSDEAGKMDSTLEFEPVVTDMPDLIKIMFVKNGFQRFPRLQNIPNLASLLLSDNYIETVPEQTLKQFSKLTTLDLSHNRIVQLGLVETPNLVLLDVSFNRLEELGAAVFSKLTKLETLLLGTNRIHTIDPKAFKSLTKLITLNLSHNFLILEDVKPVAEFPELGVVGGFFDDEFDYQSPFRYSMKMEKLDLSFNQIQIIFNDWKFLFGELKLLDLSHNRISYLHSTTFNFLANDLTLDISNNNISTIEMDNAEFFLEDAANRALRYPTQCIVIFIDGNPINCDCNLVAFKNFKVKGIYFKFNDLTCAAPLWLRGIQFRLVPPTDLMCPVDSSLGCPDVCTCWNIPANKTIAVDCSSRGLGDTYIPYVHDINGKWAQNYDFTLNLSGNNISDLDANRSQNISSRIVKVDLSRNALTSLTFLNGDILANNNVSQFYLASNKFSCEDCAFHKILRSNFKRVPDYDQVSCYMETDEGGDKQLMKYLVKEFPEEQVCLVNITAELQAMIVATSIFLIFLIVFIALYFRYGWALRAFLYSKGFGCCFGFDEAEDELAKNYDAFISYSHKDEDWVLSQLVARLEEQGFKLCLHFRDWTPGDWIPDQIVRSVDKSRRTIVILSKHFMESVWSRLEFKAAHSQALSDKASRLILVMMDEDLKDQDVKDDDLRVYMKMNTYLKYDDPWFWHKLKYALPHRKPSSIESNLLKQQQREKAIQLDKLRAKIENTIVA